MQIKIAVVVDAFWPKTMENADLNGALEVISEVVPFENASF